MQDNNGFPAFGPTFFSALFWQDIIQKYLTDTEIDSLESFGHKYGSEALQTKLVSVLNTRTPKTLSREIADVLHKSGYLPATSAKETTQKKRTDKKYSGVDADSTTKKVHTKFVHAFARNSQPLIQSLLLMHFWWDIMLRWFDEQERKAWAERFEKEDATAVIEELKQMLQERTGKRFETMMQCLTDDLVESYSTILVESSQNVSRIDASGESQNLSDAMVRGDVAKAGEILQKISQVDS